MSYINYHIRETFPSKIFQLLSFLLGVLSNIKKSLKIRIKRTGVIVRLNKILNRIYIISEGLKAVAGKYDKEKAAQEYEAAQELLSTFRSLYARLEKCEFFNNSDTQELAESTLSNFYTIEALLRSKAFSDESIIPEDDNLIDFASRLSLSSLPENRQ